MECGDTAHFVNMDMDTECIISHMETLHNIHMHTDMDMDTEYGSTWSVETICNIHMDTNMDMDTECESIHGVCFESITVDHHSETNLSLRSGVFRCLSTPVLNRNLHIDSNRKYIWILHTQGEDCGYYFVLAICFKQ